MANCPRSGNLSNHVTDAAPWTQTAVQPGGSYSVTTTAAIATGFIPVSLGTIVLRVETATLFCLSALRYEFAGFPETVALGQAAT